MEFTEKDIARFWSKVDKADSCWLWTGSVRTDKYGKLNIQNKTISAHRISWIVHNGKIPDGLYVCHKCDIKLCVNPKHLWLGTCRDNLSDLAEKRLLGKMPYYKRNGSGLIREDVIKIIALKKMGEKTSVLAERFKVSKTTIIQIYNGSRWKHIKR